MKNHFWTSFTPSIPANFPNVAHIPAENSKQYSFCRTDLFITFLYENIEELSHGIKQDNRLLTAHPGNIFFQEKQTLK